MKTMSGLALLLAFTLTGCSSARTTYLPDGHKGYIVLCRRPLHRWDHCLWVAGRICGSQGYVIRYGDEIDREMTIACGADRIKTSRFAQNP